MFSCRGLSGEWNVGPGTSVTDGLYAPAVIEFLGQIGADNLDDLHQHDQRDGGCVHHGVFTAVEAVVDRDLSQTAADAKDRLEATLAQLESTFTSFTPGQPASTTIGKAKGYYCYYKAEYNDGTRTYNMRGRIAIVAHEKALYQVRTTTPQTWYSYYENVFRKVRNSFKFN